MAAEHKPIPIAVIGLGCRFPSDVTSGEKFWELLVSKKSARAEVPTERFNVDAFYHPDGDRYGTANVRGGHYLTEDVSLFDAPFFSISPAEAMAMDPMQRLLLEVTYEALENSGTPLAKVAGTKTSCFVGCFTKDYEEMQRRDIEIAPKYQSTGASQTLLSNRLSYYFNLKGPSVSLDTACSSGLVAVHLACQSLRTGESTMAIAGGSNLILSPDIQIEMSDMHFLGPDSISYAFDERANGYARGEGMGAVILKPLDLALRDNDPIRAVIRGTAASSDGRTSGITMPSKQAQTDLIRSAYQAAGCNVGETGYFEAHGTGTAAGDPIETGTVGEVFASSRPIAANGLPIPLSIGSVKTNIGHLEGASGIAGLIKAVLSVEKGIIAPNIWFERGNPAIDFENWRLQVPTEPQDWPLEGVRRASINSFGYGGTNAHVILDDAFHFMQQQRVRTRGHIRNDSGFVSPVSETSRDDGQRSRIFLLSANDEHSLSHMGNTLSEHLQTQSASCDGDLLDNLAYTLCERRSRLSHISSVIASNQTELQSKLQRLTPLSCNHSTPPRISFVFTGQGGQWWAMGRELLRYPVFKNTLLRCDTIVRSFGKGWSLMEELLKDKASSRVNEAGYSQPLCTALQLALVDLWESWNVIPDVVVGHSSGEIAAAYAAGALDTQSAMNVAFLRGHLSPTVKSLGYHGRMMAVGLSEEQSLSEIAAIGEKNGKVVVACVNSPQGVTISGDAVAVEELQKSLSAKGIFAKLLQVDTAYHSHHMQAIAEDYLTHLQDANVIALEPKRHVQMFSSVTEELIDPSQLGAEYWVTNLVSCVRFSGAVQKLCTSDQSTDVLLEVGPHALFKLPVKEILEATHGEKSNIQYLSTLIRNNPADITALEAAGHLSSIGSPVDLHAINFPTELKQSLSVLTDLPQYPWNHTRSYWCESRLSKDYRFRKFPRTDILGAPVYDWNPLEPRWRNFMRLREQPWLRDHVVQGDVLFPACGYLCMAIEACRQMCVIAPSTFLPPGSDSVLEYRLREVSISRAMVVPEAAEGVETSFSMRCRPGTGGSDPWHEFRIFSYTTDGGWAENCSGLVSVSSQSTVDDSLSADCLTAWNEGRTDTALKMDTRAFYKGVDSLGLTYGPLFQGLEDITVDGNATHKASGIIQVTDTRAENPKQFEHDRLLHPATLDSFLQLALAALGGPDLTTLKGAMVPTFVEEITVCAKIAAQIGDKLNVVVNAERHGAREARGSIFALDHVTSRPVVLLDGFKFVAINSGAPSAEIPSPPKHCYTPVWEPDVELIDHASLNRELQAAPKPDDRPKTVRELELLSYHFIDQALQQVKASEVDGMLPHHQKFYRNLCKLRDAVVAQTHPQQTEEWQDLQHPEVAAKIKGMVEHYRTHESAYDGKLLVRVGEALPAVFRQEVEPLALMTHGNLLEDYYTTAVGMPNTYAQISRFTNMLSHKYPNLDWLEIGAGTGGATVPTLKGLSGCEGVHQYPRLKSYTYTDISSYFFQRAAEKFEDFAQFMQFKKLDVEHDPETQDFKPASYDVIVAANVLHATSDMHRTMTHARKLLRPGGKLILLEMTNRLLAASVIFGTLPGWWNASEEWRTEGPLLTEGQWEDVLQATGFSSLQASSPDVLEPLEEGTRLMIASAVESKPTISNGLPTPPERHRIIIICADSPIRMNRLDMPLALKSKFETSGLQAQLVPLGKLDKTVVTDAVCISFVELDEPLFAHPSPKELNLLQTIAEASAGLIWVTRGAASDYVERPELAVFQGLARTLRSEHESFSCITVDLDVKNELSANGVADVLSSVYNRRFGPEKVSPLADSEFVEQGGVLHIKRAIEDDTSNEFLLARTDPAALPPKLENVLQEGRMFKLRIPEAGVKGPFVFEDDSKKSLSIQAHEVEISVQAASLRPQDIQILNGELPGPGLGQECSGVVTKIGKNVTKLSIGDRVVSWNNGTFATHIRIPAVFIQKISETTAFETAASLPLAYTTACYALRHVAHLDASETVLIHEAASPVGQAALHLATSIGAKVYVTVRSDEERDLLISRFSIDLSQVFSSQDLKFVAALRRATQGRGVDVVLNTLSGEALQATFSCVASFGRFVDLGANNHAKLEMAPFGRNVSFTSVDIASLYAQKSRLAAKVFQEAMTFATENLLQEGPRMEVKPWSQLPEAIELVQDSKSLTSVIMKPTSEDQVLIAQSPPTPLTLDPTASYLLAGGLGGLGRSIAHWLTTHGAKNLIFLSRSGASSPSASTLLSTLHGSGIRTAVLKCDISSPFDLSAALTTTLQSFPPIKGIIQGAMTLNDALFTNMTHEQWLHTLHPKLHGSKNLHEVTLNQPLDFFILLSSLHSFIGNPGQANYAAGCAYQVALARYRNNRGLPGVALDLGIVGGVGYVVEKQQKKKKKTQDTDAKVKVQVQDFKHIQEQEMLALIEWAIRNPNMGHLVTGLDSARSAAQVAEQAPFFASNVVLSHLPYLRPHLVGQTAAAHTNTEGASAASLPLPALLAATSSADERQSLVLDALLKKLSRSLMMEVADLDPLSSLSKYGTDSLVAVEIKNWIGRETGVSVSVFEILQAASIGGLVGGVVGKIGAGGGEN
ncbi:polyketide synthase-like protein [Plenodomus tracheiphilus IPT5]|uniref:Polyketide synthase-like protein n=1 Tax=Plenodomus tracheiphilus IPT5 TaxID=1408161 RepID=A0A6A7AW64_9PLEO|nr:polyketide synthase-like protein [Plenodomus tracheiphilus IPT5]